MIRYAPIDDETDLRPPTQTMTVCLRIMLQHRRLPLTKRPTGYVLTQGPRGALFGWFPSECVIGLKDRGLVDDRGLLTEKGIDAAKDWYLK